MRQPSVRIDYDETGCGHFKVRVGYHEGDTADRVGQSTDVVVYVSTRGRSLPESGPEIYKTAIAAARKFLQRILDET